MLGYSGSGPGTPTETARISSVQSGDLLAWKSNPNNRVSDLLIRGIASMTRSVYGHVGIAWRYGEGDEEVLVFEATIPQIKISALSLGNEVDIVPMSVPFDKRSLDWLLQKLDLRYGLRDAWRAYRGETVEKDDRWQCAELCHYFYAEHDIKLFHDFTPGGVVSSALTYTNASLCRLK